MKAADGWIIAIGLAALALAATTVYRSRQSSAPSTPTVMPSIDAPAPPSSAFPACQSIGQDEKRWNCEVEIARRHHQLRCYGQRLYYVTRDTAGKTQYRPWPARLQCWNSADETSR